MLLPLLSDENCARDVATCVSIFSYPFSLTRALHREARFFSDSASRRCSYPPFASFTMGDIDPEDIDEFLKKVEDVSPPATFRAAGATLA